MDLPDPPGHTVFLYLQELNRKELQKQAKAHGIKANQKNEVLRQKLQEVLTTRKVQQDGVKQEDNTSSSSVTNEENKDPAAQITEHQEPKKKPTLLPSWKSNTPRVPKNKQQATQTTKVKFAPSTNIKTFTNKQPTIIKTPTRRVVLGERNMNTRRPLSNSKNTKNGSKPSSSIVLIMSPVRDVSNIIKTKNSPYKKSSSSNIGNNKSSSKPVLLTHDRPRPKPMPLSKRNELQYQKFLERQNKGRKVREEQLRINEFAHLVRSPVRARWALSYVFLHIFIV